MTQAGMILEYWHSHDIKLPKLARKAGAKDYQSKLDKWRMEYHFSDGSVIITEGRGKNYKAYEWSPLERDRDY